MKIKKSDELVIANKELELQKQEKKDRAAELAIANEELIFQSKEKENRAAELAIANKELLFQNEEKQNRAAELIIANKELAFQNSEKKKRVKESKELEVISNSLKQASQYARSLIEASLDPLVTISTEGKITDVNEASVKVTGVPRVQLIGTDFSDYFTEPQKAREGYKQVFEKEFVSDYPLTIHHKNGTLTDVLYNASVYKDEMGNVLGVFAAARDVTAQKQASQYARSLIEASLDPLVTISPKGKITDVNEASVKVTGVPRLKLMGTDFSDYFTEPEKAREGYKQVFEQEFVSDYPLTIRHKNGTLSDVLYNASVYKDEEGNVLGVFAAARDVTAQKAEELIIANKELILQNKEKEKQAAVLEIANKELAFQNEEKENRAAELVIANKELAFQNEEKENRAAELVIANKELHFQNEEKENRAAELVIANKELAFQNEEKENRAAELVIANKELAFQNEEKENRAAELVIANKELAFQNEEKENRAAELVIANKELLFQNEEKEKRAKELVIANKELLFQNEEKENRAAELIIANKELAFQNEEKEKRAKELVIANKELLFQNEEKENRAAELIIANKEMAFQNEEKEKRAKELGFANGELKQAEEDIRKLNDELENKVIERTAQLESVNKELGSFSYSVSHDLRAPIRAINGYSKILIEDYAEKFDAEGEKVLHSIIHNSKKMGDLIDDLLAFSKLGRKQVTVSDINMMNLVRQVREELIFDETEKLPIIAIKLLPAAKGDQSLIKQVWINLISNAIKYSKYKPMANIEIGAYEKDNLVVYFVKDEGAGFDMQYYDKLFGVFQRLHSQEEFEGTGIGLAIVQKIIHRHGGTVWAESTINEGTCFYFSLPAIDN